MTFRLRQGAPTNETMDGESPAWLEGGDAQKATTTAAAPSSLMSEDNAVPTASAARTGLDNASASTFLPTTTAPKKFGFGKKKAATDATTAPASSAPLTTSQVLAGEADLSKRILFMRLVNMAAAALLITTSVSFSLLMISSGGRIRRSATCIVLKCV